MFFFSDFVAIICIDWSILKHEGILRSVAALNFSCVLKFRKQQNWPRKFCILEGKQCLFQHQGPQPGTVSCVAMAAEMPREVKVKTLEGGDLTVKVVPTNTIEDLKAMLHEKKHCEDPIERQILKVEVLADGLLVDSDQTLESAGLLRAESEVTVIYSRNIVEAATQEAIQAIHTKSFLQVNIPSSLTEIPPEAFRDCNQVVRVTMPESVTVIGDAAFAYCEFLASIAIPESVTVIGISAFFGCSSLASMTIPESVTTLGIRAFQCCYSLRSVTIPSSVTAIGDYAFAACHSLESITIPESVTAIGTSAFQTCASLASITIPESVTAIGDCAFHECKSLASITIPESVMAIGVGAFHKCESLQSITIPESLRKDGQNVFDGKLQGIIQHVWLRLFSVLELVELRFSTLNRLTAQSGLNDEFSLSYPTRGEKKRAMKPKGVYKVGINNGLTLSYNSNYSE